jgi:hypothetical protein
MFAEVAAKVCPSSEALTIGVCVAYPLFYSSVYIATKNSRKRPKLPSNMYIITILEIKNVTPPILAWKCMNGQAILGESCDR